MKRNNNNNHNNHKMFNFKELKKNWEVNAILSLIIVSAYMVGIFTGSVNWNKALNGYYHPPTDEEEAAPQQSDVMMDPVQADTVDTEILSASDDSIGTYKWGDTLSSNQRMQITYDGLAISENNSLSGFQCRINEQNFVGCSGTNNTVVYHDMSVGEYVFEVRAVDNNGDVDHTPAVWIWRVEE